MIDHGCACCMTVDPAGTVHETIAIAHRVSNAYDVAGTVFKNTLGLIRFPGQLLLWAGFSSQGAMHCQTPGIRPGTDRNRRSCTTQSADKIRALQGSWSYPLLTEQYCYYLLRIICFPIISLVSLSLPPLLTFPINSS